MVVGTQSLEGTRGAWRVSATPSVRTLSRTATVLGSAPTLLWDRSGHWELGEARQREKILPSLKGQGAPCWPPPLQSAAIPGSAARTWVAAAMPARAKLLPAPSSHQLYGAWHRPRPKSSSWSLSACPSVPDCAAPPLAGGLVWPHRCGSLEQAWELFAYCMFSLQVARPLPTPYKWPRHSGGWPLKSWMRLWPATAGFPKCGWQWDWGHGRGSWPGSGSCLPVWAWVWHNCLPRDAGTRVPTPPLLLLLLLPLPAPPCCNWYDGSSHSERSAAAITNSCIYTVVSFD